MFDRIDRELVLAHPQTVTRANNMMNMLIAKHGDSVKEEIYSYLEFFESKYLKGITPNSELIEWINKNNGKYKFHLWTSQMSRSLDKILPMAGLEDVFTQKIARDMVKMAKPYPYGFELIFAEQGGEKQDYLMVGDSEFDEGAAKNAGIDYYFENFFKK